MLGFLPTSTSAALSTVALVLGATASWFAHPLIWLCFGPFRWIAAILMTAAQESSYNASAEGDDGASVGILQFTAPTWEALGGDPDRRTSSMLSGWYAGAYVQNAILTDVRWLWMAVPVYGYAVMRFLWTHGAGSGLSIAGEAWSSFREERWSGIAIVVWRGITIWPALWLFRSWWRPYVKVVVS